MKLSEAIKYKAPLNRKGMFSKWTAQLGDVVSVQPSKEQATTELLKSVTEALTGSYEPIIVFKGDYYVCCWRDFDGWRYAIRKLGEGIEKGGYALGFDSRDECKEYAEKHLAEYLPEVKTA